MLFKKLFHIDRQTERERNGETATKKLLFMISDFHNKYMRSVLFWEQRTSQANSHFSQFCEHTYNR